MTIETAHLGFTGIYQVTEAARYLYVTQQVPSSYKVNSQHLLYWIRHGLALPPVSTIPGRQLFITFEDLISMRVIALLRSVGVKLSKIRKAEDWLRRETGYPRPFAIESLWTDRSQIFADFHKMLVDISREGQYAFDFYREYLIPVHGLTFDQHGVVKSWLTFEDVLLDPKIQFGEPCVRESRIPTRAIWSSFIAGDTVELIASSYEISSAQVQHAIEWESRLAA